MNHVSLERDRELRGIAFRELAHAVGRDGLIHWHAVRDPIRTELETKTPLRLLMQQQGIWKPAALRYLLSLRSSHRPRSGDYGDFSEAIHAIQRGDSSIVYQYTGDNPGHTHNQWIQEACLAQAPIIFFLGIAQGQYFPIAPAYIAGFDNLRLECQLVFGAMDGGPQYQLPEEPERVAAMRSVRERLSAVLPRELF